MKIELRKCCGLTLEQFADLYGLVMLVDERYNALPQLRYYARFKDAEVKEGTCFGVALFGDGATPEEAISAYAKLLSHKILIVHPATKDRCEIQVPLLSYEPSSKPN